MANRDLSNFRTVINQVPDASDIVVSATKAPNAFLDVGIDVATQIMKEGQQAKITEGLSEAQLQLNALQNQYQIDFEGDPMAGLAEYKEKRQEIFDTYGEQVSPLFRRQWDDSVRNISVRNDATQQGWALKQTRVNTINSVNKSMLNNFKTANSNGQKFGEDESAEIEAFVDFGTSMQELEKFGAENLGEETTGQMLDTYEEDYMKSFLSGVSETNPLKALQLLETDLVKDSFSDPQQYGKMRDAIENRAINIGKINADKEILGILKQTDNLLAKSAQQPISYAELQQEFEKNNMSKSARSYFLKLNGFSGGTKSLTPSEKSQYKAGLYDMIRQVGEMDNVSSKDLAKFQDKIYEGMDLGALTKKEGDQYLNGLLAPVVKNKEDMLDNFQLGKWKPWEDNIGFDQLDSVLEQVNVKPPEGEAKVGVLGQNINNQNKVDLYEYYQEGLEKEGAARGIAWGDITSQDKTVKREIYTKAQNHAKKSFWVDRYPELAGMETLPDTILTSSGKKISTGLISEKPVASVGAAFKIMEDANGNRARVYSDGRIEEIE